MRLTKLFSIYLLCFCFVTTGIKAQYQEPDPVPAEKGFDKSRLFYGGNFGLSFGTYTIVNVSPQVGYRINEYLAAGVGINGQYYSVKYENGTRDEYGVAGFNVFGRFYPIPQLFAQLQPELNYTWGKTKYQDGPTETYDSKMRPALLVGAGGIIPAGKSSLILMVQYDLLGELNVPPYGNKPFFGFGVNIGF